MTWLALGFPFAFDKGQRGRQVDWVGHSIHVDTIAKKVTSSIKAQFLADLHATTRSFLKKNVLSLKEVRSYAGSANHVATLLWGWRPFLEELWAAITSPSTLRSPACVGKRRKTGDAEHNKEEKRKKHKSNAPTNCIWTAQAKQALVWIDAFLSKEVGDLTRCWHLEHYLRKAADVTFNFDASPCGIGGTLVRFGRPVSWFMDAITDFDIAHLGIARGE